MAGPMISHVLVACVNMASPGLMTCEKMPPLPPKKNKNKKISFWLKKLLYHALNMDALANWQHGLYLCIGQMDGLVARTLSLFGHGCTGPWMGW